VAQSAELLGDLQQAGPEKVADFTVGPVGIAVAKSS
jgi:hypothetical protein